MLVLLCFTFIQDIPNAPQYIWHVLIAAFVGLPYGLTRNVQKPYKCRFAVQVDVVCWEYAIQQSSSSPQYEPVIVTKHTSHGVVSHV